MLNFLIAYLAIGVACVPLTFYTLYTTDETNRREDPMIFWLVMLTLCTATVPLWPVFVALLINHVVVVRKSNPKPEPRSMSEWIALEESWKKITALSEELDAALSGFLDSDEMHGDTERRIRNLLAQIDEEYDRWATQKNKIPIYFGGPEGEEKPLVETAYLREGPGWPRVRVSIDVEVDLATNTKRISHSTVRILFPEEPPEKPEDDQTGVELSGSDIVLYKRAEITPVIGEPHPWNMTLSGRFSTAVKKLRGTEREKVETAVTDIMLSPTTVLGNTKTPLSNNLRDFWRYRLGDWRIIYTVDGRAKTVTMLDYTHRSKAYH